MLNEQAINVNAGEYSTHLETLSWAELIQNFGKQPDTRVVHRQNCGGGCIHRAQRIELSTGQQLFVKSNHDARDMFRSEAEGLLALGKVGVIRVPEFVGVCALDDGSDGLAMEYIHSSPPGPQFSEDFGHAFAELHQQSRSQQCGWTRSNYLGSTPQLNALTPDWIEFFAESRLQHLLRLIRNQGQGNGELFQRATKLCERLAELLAGPQEICLLHGDLWSGNFLCASETGLPVIFDPATFWGHREYDLAMPLLFGGFSQDFFDAYQEHWPLASGWRERVEVYKLHHLLNHLNLFGSGYLDSCLEILRRFV